VLPLLATLAGISTLVIELFLVSAIPDPNSPVNASNTARL